MAAFFGFRGVPAITYVDLRPGWCRGPEGLAHAPTCVRLPGKPRASGNGGWRGTQRGARSLRSGRSTLIHIPGGDPGGDVGRPGQVREEVLWLRVPKVG